MSVSAANNPLPSPKAWLNSEIKTRHNLTNHK